MKTLLWDSSALAKRYAPENGSLTVDAVFTEAQALNLPMVGVSIVYSETFSLLVRKRNRGDINVADFRTAVSALQKELLRNPSFNLLPVDNAAVLASVTLIDRHNINSSDALMLVQYLRHISNIPGASGILIASDARLLRAGVSEGLTILDPEQVAVVDVRTLLTSP